MRKAKNVKEKRHYTEVANQVLDFELMGHCSLRTCFDPWSHEWTETDMETKIDILKKVLIKGKDLNKVLFEYRTMYNKMGKTHVSNDLEDGLITLLLYLLTKKEKKQITYRT
mgnify:CR=1 FL=1